jgi:predicted nucleic acid-binding protein
MRPVLVDSNVVLDVAYRDPDWGLWSRSAIEQAASESVLVINPIVYAEISVGYRSVEDLEDVVPADVFRREPLPYEAAFLAGKCFLAYRRSGGRRRSPLTRFVYWSPRGRAGLPFAHPRCGALSNLFSITGADRALRAQGEA